MAAKLKPRPRNYIRDATEQWLATVPPPPSIGVDSNVWKDELLNATPKRFTIYEPLALLPTGSFTSQPWRSVLDRCGQDACQDLWKLVLIELSKAAKGSLTHLAVNEGIPLQKNDGGGDENVMRSPSGLRMLAGDFGPSSARVQEEPRNEDFESALWVSTKQNGIHQTWAPRWTMFSRGNVKEKARLLDFGRPESPGADGCWAVDLYAGIGYFVFSYASLGMRVLCWEINPWSVEGLRRGAEANGWGVRVVQGADLDSPTEQLIAGDERIVVFLEDNQRALARIEALWTATAAGGGTSARDIRHINCGFLPTSEPTWEQAWALTRHSARTCRLHLHENVGAPDVDSRMRSIQERFEGWRAAEDAKRRPGVGHVELVKTFAPGVWHCVFDVDVEVDVEV